MEQENWVLREVDREDDESLTLTFYCGSLVMLLTFPKDKIERILEIYGKK